LTDTEILSNAYIFFIAAYDTTSNALTFSSYCLATNPECQDRLIDEIDRTVGQVTTT
jgi:cytochrome P450 family 3 subfamily A